MRHQNRGLYTKLIMVHNNMSLKRLQKCILVRRLLSRLLHMLVNIITVSVEANSVDPDLIAPTLFDKESSESFRQMTSADDFCYAWRFKSFKIWSSFLWIYHCAMYL